jgi:pimeloyl-ACP methyl ester carboxylesterase
MRFITLIAALLCCSCVDSGSRLSQAPAALGNRPISGFAPVDGGTIHFQAAGEGPPLILLHGGGMDMSMWDALVPTLTRHHRVIRWDARGHGASTAPPDRTKATAEDLRSLLDHLQIGRATIVGFSMGAGTAANFAIVSPERVERLVLISTAAPPPGAPRIPGAPPPLAEREGRTLLAKSSVPVLMIVGSKDSDLVRATGSAVASEVPSARLIELENASHGVVAEQPAQVASAIMRWAAMAK